MKMIPQLKQKLLRLAILKKYCTDKSSAAIQKTAIKMIVADMESGILELISNKTELKLDINYRLRKI